MKQETISAKNRPASASNLAIRLVIVDPYPIMRYGMTRLLGDCPDLDVVGEFSNCAECYSDLAAVKPDVALVDLGTIQDSAVKKLCDCYSGMKTIGYSQHDSDWHVIQTMKTGVQGFFLKTAPIEKILESIHAVYEVGSFLDPTLVSKMLVPAQRSHDGRSLSDHRLSQREREILEAMACGQTNKGIANKLALTERTVKYHVSSILRKFDASNRAEAIRFATQNGIIKI